ncbi:transposase [Neisseria sp. Dent CA1/247]|uniref:transposase n=1 Tax=Neisseria sp. Dent CA1/247 TaxID=2912675 RepID=UPI001FD3F25B|nr:transposase [Neisseria sp. Dent CA1/247]UOO76746.1 transposase [Neisseria sp. Dent CA1/247]
MYLGIDVSKEKLDCCLISDGIFYEREFANTPIGYGELKKWLDSNKADKTLHCCCEATGIYYEDVAEYLSGHYKISVENPRKIKGFGIAVLQRSKTDKQDAKLIAQYCKVLTPEPWQKPSPEHKQLQEITRYIARIKKQRAAELTKQQTAPDYIKPHIADTIAHFNQLLNRLKQDLQAFYKQNPSYNQNKKRLKTISGIGETSASILLAALTNRFDNPAQFTAYLGLDPRMYQSGTSVKGRQHISKVGKSDLRAALYMPALVAYRMNAFPDFIGRLKQKKKPFKVIIVAIMRKLAVIAFHILKNQTEYDKSRYKTAG